MPNRETWNAIMQKAGKEFRATMRLQVAYEVLRQAYLKAGGTPDGAVVTPEAQKIATEMQANEAKLVDLWKPHQKMVGACPKCKGVRVPGSKSEGYGFGCVSCHDFQIFGSPAA